VELDEVIERVDARKRLWEELAAKIEQWLSGKIDYYPHEVLQQLGKAGDYLLSDYYYDAECAWHIVSELQIVLNLLRWAKEEGERRLRSRERCDRRV
jgi:hypothetical protein